MLDYIVRGDFIGGSAVMYRKVDGRLQFGLDFGDGTEQWYHYHYVGRFYSGLAVIDTGEGMGYINRRGEEVVPPVFTVANDFSEDRAFLRNDETTILIDPSINYIAFFEQDVVTHEFRNGTALLSRLSQPGEYTEEALINLKGEFITDFMPPRKIAGIDDIITEVPRDSFHEGIEYFMEDGCRGVMDSSGRALVEDFTMF